MPARRVTKKQEQAYVFFGGKGGVGKTTCATAAALRIAESGNRVLVVSTDPAHSLGDALALRLSAKPKKIPVKRGSLHAVELDADAALERWVKKRKRSIELIAEHGTYLDSDDIDQLLKLSLPGVDELVGLVELRQLARSGDYQQVVVDTAPTGHTLRLLEMPETLRRIAAVFDDMQAKHRFLAASLAGRYRGDVGDELIDEIDTEGRELIEILRDPDTAHFNWVLLPEMVTLEETKDGVGALQRSGITVREIIVNRVKTPPPEACAFCEAEIHAQQQTVGAIQKAFPKSQLLQVPRLDREPRGLSEFHRHARQLEPAPAVAPSFRVKKQAHHAGKAATTTTKWIDTLVSKSCRLLLFGGKGGVGKTTSAATCAMVLAERERNRKILLLSTDPAHSLGDVIQIPLSDDARSVPGFPSLRAREMNAEKLFLDRRERYLESIDELFDSLQGGSHLDAAYDRAVARDLIDLSPPGLDEIFAILSVNEALLSSDASHSSYDLVVVDMAPTGHALRLLEMPAKALAWVHTLLSILLKYRKVVGLGSFASDLLNASKQMRQLSELLHNASLTRLVAVTRPAQLPRLETARLLADLSEMKIAVSAILFNDVNEGACKRCRHERKVELKEIAALSTKQPRLVAPAVAPPPRGIDGLRQWANLWRLLPA